MIFTQYDFENFKNNPWEFINDVEKKVKEGDTQLVLAREPLTELFPKEEGIFFIHNKLLELEEFSTENIASTLKDYTDFMKKNKIQIIKEFDEECTLSYKGELPNINVDRFKTQSFFGFNKFQIIDGYTLSREDKKDTIGYLKTIDFTYALDSNAASFFVRYITNNDDMYKLLYEEVIKDENNIDIAPYIFEIVMHGVRDFGIYFKLNKKNKNKTQEAFFYVLKMLHKEGLFKEKKEKTFINNIIKNTNRLISYYGILGLSAQIFLLSMLEAKCKFGNSSNKIKDYVYTEMRKHKIPIENKLKAILYFFCDKPGHEFFKKVINIQKINNFEKYMKNVDNTARDIALLFLDKYMYSKLDIYPFIGTDDQGLRDMIHETKPDYIIRTDDMNMPIYKNIDKDMRKKHLKFFETEKVKDTILFHGDKFKEVMKVYQDKKNEFINLITNQNNSNDL